MKKIIFVITILSFLSCGSSRRMNENSKAVYIAPKGWDDGVSHGAFFFDGSVRMATSTIFPGTNPLVKFLAEEQPDAIKEIARILSTSLEVSGEEETTGNEGKITADLLTSFSNSIVKLTEKSYSLSLSRSLLYRYNENIYNGGSDTNLNKFLELSDNLIELQAKEFEEASKREIAEYEKIKETRLLLQQLERMGVDKDSILDLIPKY